MMRTRPTCGREGPSLRGVAVIVAALLAAACARSAGPEEAVREWLDDAQAAAEARDHGRLMGMISANYADSRGNDRDDIDRLLRLLFLRNESILLVSQVDELTMVGNAGDASAATVLLTVGMAGSDSGILGLNADAYRFELELERQREDWRLIGARWAEVGQPLR